MLGQLKAMLGIADPSQDGLLQFTLDNVQEQVLNYCHIDTLPDGLKNTVLRMALDTWRAEGFGNAGRSADVTNIKRDDVSTSFGYARAAQFDGSILKDYKAQLNRYRKVAFQ